MKSIKWIEVTIKVWNILYSLKDEDGSYKWIGFQKAKKEEMLLRQRHALVRKGASEDAIWSGTYSDIRFWSWNESDTTNC